MKSQAEDMLEIDKVGGWSRIGGLCDFKGVSLLTRRFSVTSVDICHYPGFHDSLEFSMILPSIKLNKENTRLFSSIYYN